MGLEKRVADLEKRVSELEKRRGGGRLPFGFIRRDGEEVVDDYKYGIAVRVLELRESGMVYQKIKDSIFEEYGFEVSVSTIDVICKHPERYEKKMRSRWDE